MGIIERKKRILLNEPHIATATGTVANFNTDMKAPLKSCKVEFNPVQSGSGDPSPTNVRPITGWTGFTVNQEGKNLIDKTQLTGTSSVWWKGNVVAGYPDHCVTPLIPVKPGATYYLSRNSANQDYLCYFGKDGTTYIGQEVWSTISGTLNEKQIPDNVYYVGITIGTDYKDTAYFQFDGQEEEWTDFINGQTFPITFPATKNLLNPAYRNDTYAVNSILYYKDNGITLASGTYTLSCSNKCAGIYVRSGTSSTSIFSVYNSKTLTFTLTESTTVNFNFYKEGIDHSSTCQLEVGSNATSYEPYGTVYGGYVDISQGTITATHIVELFDGSDDEQWTTSGSGTYVAKTVTIKPYSTPIADKYVMESVSSTGTGYNIRPVGNNTDYATLTAWKEYIASNPLQVVYELATPVEYQLTPQQIKSIIGTNNIWSTSNGNVEVKYWKH